MRLLGLFFFFVTLPSVLLFIPLPSQGYSHGSSHNDIGNTDAINASLNSFYSTRENCLGRRATSLSPSHGAYGDWDATNTCNIREAADVECRRGFARVERVDTGTVECVDCARMNRVIGIVPYTNHSQRCVRCGGETTYVDMVDASYNADSLQCLCPEGYELVEQLGSHILSSQMCLRCPSQDCTTCDFPYTLGKTGSCVCSNGFTTLYDNSCVPTEVYESITRVAVGAATRLQLPNMEDKDIPEPLVTSTFAQRYSNGSAVQCFRGNKVGCHFLLNLCVLMLYDVESLPCKLYLSLLNAKEAPKDMPQLYFHASSTGKPTITATTTTPPYNMLATDVLEFVVDVYSWRGIFKGRHRSVNEFNLCRASETHFLNFFKLGVDRRLWCSLDSFFSRLYTAAPTDFFELYLVNPRNKSHLIPVPVALDFSKDDMYPAHLRDVDLFAPTSDNYRRRFYIYDNMDTINENCYENTTERHYLIALRRVAFMFIANGSPVGNHFLTPIVSLQYASKVLDSNALLSDEGESKEGGITVIFLTSSKSVNQGMMIAMIILCVMCFISAWIRTYSWMRRRQNMILSLGAIIRFLVYLCNHIGNMFAITVSLATWYLFAIHRAHYAGLTFAVHDRYVYIEAMLFTATVTKGIAVMYKVVEQCNADYFVIDWERSKGQLLRENKILPVSMWRSTFVANELNELQTLRRWRPLLAMVIVLLFLIGLDYMKYTMSTPADASVAGEIGVHSITTLRIAVSTFFWFSVCLTLYIVEYRIYYSFIRVHPLQAFVDLCSVSNISIMILPESQWGYYIHGESIHTHADVSMEEFQQNLFLESQGNLPVRGLGGQSQCQTFEVFMGIDTRQYLYMCYGAIETERQRTLGNKEVSVQPGKRWHFFQSIFGFSRKSRVYNSESLAIKKRVNSVLQQSVRGAESTLLMKFPLQRLFDLAPNILYMNGPQSGERMCKDLFFVNNVNAYGNAFLYGIDMDLFVLYTMLYVSIDAAMHNVFTGFVITFALELIIRWYRKSEGEANISSKTLIDDRFFL